MAVITRRVGRTTQPVGPVTVDPSLGIQAAFVGGKDVLNKGAALVGTTPVAVNGGAAAVRGPIPGGANLQLGIPVGTSWSLIMQMTPLDIATNFPYFLGISVAPNPISLTAKHNQGGGAMLWYDGVKGIDSGVFLQQGIQATVGLTFNSETKEYCWYKDGAAFKKQAGNITGSGFWQWASLNDNLNSIAFSLFAIAEKAIPAQRMQQLTANPWSAFEPERRRAIFPVSSAPAPVGFWVNKAGVPTKTLGLRRWDGAAVVTPQVRAWNGTNWEQIQ